MHVCKDDGNGDYEIRKAYRLKLFIKVETFDGHDGVFELTMVQRGLTGGEMRLAYKASDNASRDDLVDVLTSLCSTHEKHTLSVESSSVQSSGIDFDLAPSEVRSSGFQASGAVSLESALVLEADTSKPAHSKAPSTDTDILQASSSPHLLQMGLQSVTDSKIGYALVETISQSSTTSLEDVRQKLLTELSALNDASVHELLECEDSVVNMETELLTTLGFLDDLEETVSIFDSKLHFVRDYMSVIDERMKQLELQSRGNAAVVETLGSIVKSLSLDPGTELALTRSDWEASPEGILAAVNAARKLHRAVSACLPTPPGSPTLLPPPLDTLSAVVSRRRYLTDLSKTFLNRATDYLSRSYDHMAANVEPKSIVGEPTKLTKFERLHDRACQLKPLLQCVVEARPHAGPHLRLRYCRSLNALLRQEVAVASTEMGLPYGSRNAPATGEGSKAQPLKSSSSSIVTMSPAHSTAAHELREPELMTKTMQKSDVALALERIHSTPQHSSFSRVASSRMASSREPSPKTSPRSMRKMITEMTPGRARQRNRSTGSSDLGILPDIVFSQFMMTFMPLLARQVHLCFDVLGMSEASCSSAGNEDGEREQITGEVLKGIPEAVEALVERLLLPPFGKILSSVSMAGTCVHWQTVSPYEIKPYETNGEVEKKLNTSIVKEVALRCERKIKSVWTAYVEEKLASIASFDGSSTLGMRTIHILPFIASFQAVATRLEGAYEEWNTLSRNSASSVTESPLSALKPSPFEQRSTLDRGAQGEAKRRPAVEVRALVDEFYARILPCMLEAIEDQAVESKHGARIRLENYALLRLELQNPPLSRVESLEKVSAEVGKRRNAALTVYVEQQIAGLGSQMAPLVQLGFQLAELAASGLSPSEAATRVPWTEDSLRLAMDAVATGLEKQLRTSRMGLFKSLGESSLYLVDVVWEKLKQRVIESWSELELRIPLAFGWPQPNGKLQPAPGIFLLTTDQVRMAFLSAAEAIPVSLAR